MKASETRKVYFTTPGPWTKEADHGWWNWREIFAQAGPDRRRRPAAAG